MILKWSYVARPLQNIYAASWCAHYWAKLSGSDVLAGDGNVLSDVPLPNRLGLVESDIFCFRDRYCVRQDDCGQKAPDGTHISNENKISDAYRRRALIGGEMIWS
jgi:hypothetical protein